MSLVPIMAFGGISAALVVMMWRRVISPTRFAQAFGLVGLIIGSVWMGWSRAGGVHG